MKKYKIYLYISIIIALLITSCNSSSDKSGSITTLDGKWLLKTLNGQTVLKEKAGKQMPYLVFNITDKQVSGNTGCNEIYGAAVITAKEISFTDIGMTKMFCSDAKYENEFVDAISGKNLVFRVNKNILSLSKDDVVVMILEKSE